MTSELVPQNGEFANRVMGVWLSVSEKMAKGHRGETAWIVGLMMGISLMRSHPEIALSTFEMFEGEDQHLFQVFAMDQAMEILKEGLD